MLALLAGNSGRLVTRHEFVQSVWQGREISGATVDARVASARQAIDDEGKRQRFIKTAPRRGLRVTVEVTALEGDAEVGPERDGAPLRPRAQGLSRNR